MDKGLHKSFIKIGLPEVLLVNLPVLRFKLTSSYSLVETCHKLNIQRIWKLTGSVIKKNNEDCFENHFKTELYIKYYKITHLYLNFNVLSIDVLMSKELTACNYNCKGLR